MPQFFIDKPIETGSEIEIKGSDAHHINDVLRLRKGDWLVLSDGKGNSYRATLVSAGKKAVEARITEEIRRKAGALPPCLAFAVIKHDRSEWIIQKAVELGCRHIIPYYCNRTIPKFKSADKKIDRWRDIAAGAAKQSGLFFLPQIDQPAQFGKLCGRLSQYSKTLLFWEGEQKTGLRDALHGLRPEILVVVGPEGGFDSSEIDNAVAAGATTVSLGQQILRVETAALTALAIVQYELENLSL